MKIVDGEVVSNVEEAVKSKEEMVACAIQEGNILKESSAILSESSVQKVADGEVIESHQQSAFKENDNEINVSENKEKLAELIKKEIEMEKESSSSLLGEEEHENLNEVLDDEILPPPPSDDFPPLEDIMPQVLLEKEITSTAPTVQL